jgi:hypothetical protein
MLDRPDVLVDPLRRPLLERRVEAARREHQERRPVADDVVARLDAVDDGVGHGVVSRSRVRSRRSPSRRSVSSTQVFGSSRPASMSSSVLASAAFFFCARIEDRSRVLARHREQPVIVADDEIARMDHHAVERDRHVDLARPVLVRPAMGDAGRKDRERAARDPGGIAHRAIDDDPCRPLRDRIGEHQLADQRIGQVAAAIHDQHVAGRQQKQRLVDHQIVAGPRLHREGRPRHRTARMHRPQARPTGGHARHAVAHIGDGDGLRPLDQFRRDTGFALQDSQSVGHGSGPTPRGSAKRG